MKYYFIILNWCSLFLFLGGKAQWNHFELVNNLRQRNFVGTLISKDPEYRLVNISNGAACYLPRYHYMWCQNQLLVNTDGTGHLFEIKADKSVKRLDSTCFEGYNFGSYNFVYRDTLFSLGGYGFWQFNGMLRYFDAKTAEWFIIPTNLTIPARQWHSSNFFYDFKDKKLYVIFLNPPKVEIKVENPDPQVYVQCLDLQTKKWWTTSQILNTAIIKNYDWLNPGYFHTYEGLLTIWADQLYLLDFKRNKIRMIQSEVQKNILNHLNTLKKTFLFCNEQYLFFFDNTSQALDSVLFTKNSCLESSIPLYNNTEKCLSITNSLSYGSTLLIGLLMGGLLIYLYIKNKKNVTASEVDDNVLEVPNSTIEDEIIILHKSSFKENLTETEKALLELLITNTIEGKMSTPNQMNQVLGIAKKTSKIQNNIRASHIQLINQKFMVYSGINDPLIVKERTEFDKRFFEFAIDPRYLVKVK